MADRKYKFDWSLLGDLQEGRPNLGNTTRVEVYRLMQFTMRDVIESKFGTKVADEVFYEAGKMAGAAFYKHFLEEQQSKDLNDFVGKLQAALKDFRIGVLRVESVADSGGKIVLTVDEDLDCSGLPELDYEICVYDEGFIAAILEGFTKCPYAVKEIDCWCTGDRTCRFTADRV